MSTRISYSTTTAWGQMLAEAVSDLEDVKAKFTRIKNVLDSMAQGSSYEVVETEFGIIPSSTAGEVGQTVYNLVSGTKAALDAAAIGELTRLDQG